MEDFNIYKPSSEESRSTFLPFCVDGVDTPTNVETVARLRNVTFPPAGIDRPQARPPPPSPTRRALGLGSSGKKGREGRPGNLSLLSKSPHTDRAKAEVTNQGKGGLSLCFHFTNLD